MVFSRKQLPEASHTVLQQKLAMLHLKDEHKNLFHTKGPILSKFLVMVQMQCRPKVNEQTFPYLVEPHKVPSPHHITPPPQNAALAPLILLHQGWNTG